ncbi:hypothetical protein DMA11_23155 [Marinilabiliaceae bacterium JC017]|nr:hypothetical protein DMA11_23155 [Marinilabiliaceae bacterium JC017]
MYGVDGFVVLDLMVCGLGYTVYGSGLNVLGWVFLLVGFAELDYKKSFTFVFRKKMTLLWISAYQMS